MASPRLLTWLDRLAWTLIFGGVLAIILGIATGGAHLVAGWSLGVLGGISVAGGIVLIVVRSRLPEAAAAGAQSDGSTSRGTP